MSIANHSIVTADAHSELVTSSDQLRLVEIETNIRRLKVNIACELIEIGKNLIEAKRLVKHGEWANWLEEHAGFTQRTAQNYMRLARTFGDCVEADKLTGIEASKLFLLQEMNPDDRMSFLDTHDVKTMSVREMKDEMAGVVLRIDQPVDEQRVDNSEDIWKVFDRESDPNIYKVPISLLKPIDRYEEFFGPRKGEDYVNYLKAGQTSPTKGVIEALPRRVVSRFATQNRTTGRRELSKRLTLACTALDILSLFW